MARRSARFIAYLVVFDLLMLAAVVWWLGLIPTGACTTACDCRAGLACHEHECLSGTVAVYCCDACPPEAPAMQGCQHRDGRMTTCGTP